MRFAAPLLVAAGLVVAAGAASAAPVPVMLLPFGEDDEERRKLFDALELELELSEDVVMSPGTPLFQELGTRDLKERSKEQLADTLTILEQQALIYAHFPEDKTRAVIVLFRANDASIVFAKDVVIQDAAWKPKEQVIAPMVAVLRDLQKTKPVPPADLAALGLAPAAAAAAPGEGEGEGEGETPPKEEPTPDEPAKPDEPAEPEAASTRTPGTDRVGRFSISYAPLLMQYRACNPAAPGPTPFLCAPAGPGEVTEVMINPFLSPLGVQVAGEAFALSSFGVVFDASFYSAQVGVFTGGELSDAVGPRNPFDTFGGTATIALAGRGGVDLGGTGITFGGRAGYRLSWAQTQDTTLDLGGQLPVTFTILPSWFSHQGILGASTVIGVGDFVRLFADVDLLFGYHAEGLTRVGDDPFGFGGHLQAGIDISLFAGTFLRLGVDGSAFNVNTTGISTEAQPRLSFAGERFRDGQVRLLDLRPMAGFGFSY